MSLVSTRTWPGPNEVESGGFRFGFLFERQEAIISVKLSQMGKIRLLKCEMPVGKKRLSVLGFTPVCFYHQTRTRLCPPIYESEAKAVSCAIPTS